jgi:hypothetical protein
MKFFHLLLGFLNTRFIFFFYEEIRIYVRTRNKVKVGEKEGEWIETTNGVRQGCPRSPLMFTIYLCGRYTGLYLILHNRKFRSFRNRKNYLKFTTTTQGNDVRVYLCLHCIYYRNNNT